ncbi:MAG: hypothetical protein ABSD29_19570 [Verrucomicrobiota bacterium]|jgi:DNA-directed RNA polymerase subunit L
MCETIHAVAAGSPAPHDGALSRLLRDVINKVAGIHFTSSDELHPLDALFEQRRIVAELDALQAGLDALKRLQAETATELDALLPAILDKAFRGEL